MEHTGFPNNAGLRQYILACMCQNFSCFNDMKNMVSLSLTRTLTTGRSRWLFLCLIQVETIIQQDESNLSIWLPMTEFILILRIK